MSFTIDKGIPIPSKWNSPNKIRDDVFEKLLAEMDEGDSVLFPWHTKDGEYVISKKNQKLSAQANGFMSFAKSKGCRTISRANQNGRRVWLLEKGEPNE